MRTPREVVVEEVTFLFDAGTPVPEVLARLDMSAAAVTRALQRAERYDLARPFARVARAGYVRPRSSCTDCGVGIHPESTRCRACELTRRWRAAS